MTNRNPHPIQTFIDENYENKSGTTGFAKSAGVGYQTIHKIILGLYTAIPTKVAEALAQQSDKTVDEWQKEHTLWVKREMDILVKDISSGKLEAEALFVPAYDLRNQYADFTAWREALSYSQIDFCKTFLMHQAILQKYESGGMKNLPESLISRLSYLLKRVHNFTDAEVMSYIFALKRLPIRNKG